MEKRFKMEHRDKGEKTKRGNKKINNKTEQ